MVLMTVDDLTGATEAEWPEDCCPSPSPKGYLG